MPHPWLDPPPRRRLRIPSNDLAAGVLMGLLSCGVALGLAASMQLQPVAPEEPLVISIGVLPAEISPSGGRSGPEGMPRARSSDASDPEASPTEPASTTTMTTSPSSTTISSTTPRSRGRRPAGVLPSLPGLGDLGDPVHEPGGGGSPGGTDERGGDGEGDGEGEGRGSGDGGVAAYRSTLAKWLSSRFHVESSGLRPSALTKLRVRAHLDLSEDRVVIDYRLEATGNRIIDEAARRTLESVKGQLAPEPPPGYGAVQRRIRVTFVCRPGTCS